MKFFLNYFLFTCFLIQLGCATKMYHDRRQDNVTPATGAAIPISDQVQLSTSNENSSAVAAAITTLIAYPKYYQKSTIGGICILQTEKAFDVPCPRVLVVLKDIKGNEIDKISVGSNGEFKFYPNQKKTYKVFLESDKYKMVSEVKEVTIGSEILIRIEKK